MMLSSATQMLGRPSAGCGALAPCWQRLFPRLTGLHKEQSMTFSCVHVLY
jgi:hypothetical protein